MLAGVDYSYDHPDTKKLVADEVKFVCRYLTGTHGAKALTTAELTHLKSVGLSVVLTFENSANRAMAGYVAGVADAHDANTLMRRLAISTQQAVYFAVDWDVQPHELPTVLEYVRGLNSVRGVNATGIYGGINVISYLLDNKAIGFAWQTYAWSAGRWDPRNNIEQYHNGVTQYGGNVDLDRSMTPHFGALVTNPPAVAGYPTAQEIADLILRTHSVAVSNHGKDAKWYVLSCLGHTVDVVEAIQGDVDRLVVDVQALTARPAAPALDPLAVAQALAAVPAFVDALGASIAKHLAAAAEPAVETSTAAGGYGDPSTAALPTVGA